MNNELKVVAAQVQGAGSYLDVFGSCGADSAALESSVKKTYRTLAKVLHPDRYVSVDEKSLAESAFSELGKWLSDAETAIAEGIFGKPIVLATITTRKHSYEITRLIADDAIAAYYTSRCKDANGTETVQIKIAHQPSDGDLLQTEAKALKLLRGADSNPKFHPFFPELIESFVYVQSGKPRRHANALDMLDGFHSLASVRVAYQSGLHPLDMVWMYRRMLYALGAVHRLGIVHGAVLPQHIMIHPEKHGLVLQNWCYASIAEQATFPAMKAVVASHRDWYPEEVLSKKAPSAATDILMANRCAIALLGGDVITGVLPKSVPNKLHGYFRGCLTNRQIARPGDAWQLLLEFDELLQVIGAPYFPRRFRKFSMPSGTSYAH